MKFFKDRIKIWILTACVAAAAVSMISLPVFASKETEEAIQKAREEKQQIEDAAENTQGQIDSMTNTRGDLQTQLGNLNTELSAIGENLEDLEQQIQDKKQEIAQTEEELNAAIARQEEQYQGMKKRIQFLYERGQTVYLELFMKSRSLSSYLNRSEYVEQLSAYDRMTLERYIALKEEVEAKKAQLEEEKEELDSLQMQAQEEHGRVSGLVSSTAGSIAAYSDQISAAEAVAEDLKNQLDAKNSELKALEEKLAEERRLEALSRQSVWRNISDVVFTEDDRYLLANLIYCEAGNQPYEGQVAVGAVVINRVLSGAFPSTIPGVIYQHNQFEPAMTGRLALALSRNDATPACYAAADAAMAGQTTVSDCIFFRTPIPQVTPRYVIGGHIFY
ncbi:MAG: cell wall hydrolase [Lachnospiraceae bacterium]|nr:cell wall hydrolase [Lachnospiraceae bacterium]MBQ9644470.1 cell wall hydrolase [Lachnospiraceae bacterium]